MSKLESNDLGAASKRPSARRPAADLDLPTGEVAGTTAKRVHARRASEGENTDTDPGVDRDPMSTPLRLDEESQDPGQPAALDGHAGIELGVSTTSVAPSSVPARARARRPRASQAKAARATPLSAQPTAATAAGLPPIAAVEPSARPSETRALGGVQALLPSAVGARLTRHEEPNEPPAPALDHADFADDFGLDAEYETKLRPWLDSLCERHFHVELHGAENIPAHGRALLVANHSRASVWDGIVLRAALRSHHPGKRMLRWLVDDQQFHAPFLGTFVNRLGAVRACQENAERLLLREELVAVFPEGSKATDRPYEERFRLQRFGRGGYVKLALRTGTPVIPVAIVATEHEGAVWRNRLANASRVLAAPFAALRPGLPRMGRLGMPPISARIRIYVGAAIAEISEHDAAVTQDDGLVHELNECVRSAVQGLVNASLHA
jgi:hypothetical protein